MATERFFVVTHNNGTIICVLRKEYCDSFEGVKTPLTRALQEFNDIEDVSFELPEIFDKYAIFDGTQITVTFTERDISHTEIITLTETFLYS
jgi:hypothetical protein